MSTAKHTPGPWQARWQDPIDVDDCARIAIETAPDAGDIAGIHHATRGEDEANARLIAAAPDLLAAAVEALQEADHSPLCACHEWAAVEIGPIVRQKPCDCWVSRARAAVAKATT